MSESYTIYLNSSDKQTGTNNNATFYIDWNKILKQDENVKYKVSFSITVANGYYKDVTGVATTYTVFTQLYSSIKIYGNFQCNSLTYDSKQSQSTLLGCCDRNVQTSATGANNLTIGNGYSCFFMYNPSKIINKPTSNYINIQLQDFLGNPLCDTNIVGGKYTDCTPWILILQFEPI